MRRLLPPHFVAIALLVSVSIGVVAPLGGRMPSALRVVGALPLLVGVGLTMRGAATFERLGTNIRTFDDPDRLVRTGVFARSRNPMYLGFALLLAGVAMVIGTLSAWIGPFAFLVAADRWYIPFEEERMRTTFGEEYERYRAEVPRWIGPW